MCVCGVRHVYLGFEWIYGTPLLRIIIVLQIKKRKPMGAAIYDICVL